MKREKRIISLLLSVLFLGLNINTNSVKAKENTEDVHMATGYVISPEEQFLQRKSSEDSLSKSYNEKQYSRLPSRYNGMDYDEVTGIRNQGEIGCCWAFAAYGVIESNLKKSTGEDYDFSEIHMADNNGIKKAADGGNFLTSFAYLLKGKGPVSEEDSPYPNPGLAQNVNTNKNAKTNYRVNQMEYLPYENDVKKVDDIKTNVLNYGAVACCIKIGECDYLSDDEKYLNDPNEGDSFDHGVTIVGWDDSISKNNFRYKPEGDGAFICKNSWGESHDDYGYFYVSYYDTQIRKSMAVYDDIEKLSPYEKVTNYSSLDYSKYIIESEKPEESNNYYGTVFQADEDVNLNSISVESLFSNLDCKVYIEEDYGANGFNNILNKQKANGSFKNPGAHNIRLNSPVKIKKGKKYFVCIESNEGQVISTPAEKEGTDNSYVKKGNSWKKTSGSLSITAYTSKVLASEVKSISLDKSSLNLNGGETCKLNINFNPSNATDKTVNWKTSDKDVVAVNEDGVVKAKRNGQAVITAYTELGNVKASCTINVNNTFNLTAISGYKEDKILRNNNDLKVVFNDFIKSGKQKPYFIDEDGNRYECAYKINDNNVDIHIDCSRDYNGERLKLVVPKDSFTNESGQQLPQEKTFTFKKPNKDVKKIEFKDKKFENAVKKTLNKGTGDISPSDMLNLKEIKLDDEEIWSLSGLEYAENLKKISVENSNIYNLDAVKDLDYLNEIEIIHSNISNLEPLRGKNKLYYLDIENTKLSDFSAISTLEFLQVLVLKHTDINNIDCISNKNNLQQLCLDMNEIKDISVIGNLTQLWNVYISDNQIENINPLFESCKKYNGKYKSMRSMDVSYNLLNNSERAGVVDKIKNLGVGILNSNVKENMNIKYVNGFNFISDNIQGDMNSTIEIEFSNNITNDIKENSIYVYNDDSYEPIYFDTRVDNNVLYLTAKEKVNNLNFSTITFEENSIEGLKETYVTVEPYSNLRCDIDKNGEVGMEDLAIVAKDYNKSARTADSWDINEDITKDGMIDIYDIAVVSRQIK